MATNKTFNSVPANKYVSDEGSHYTLPLIQWFRGYGSPVKYYPSTFTPDMGNTTVSFPQNVSSSTIESTYIRNMTDDFWPQENDNDKGFELIKPNTSSAVQFNMEVSSGKGLWMPCPIYRSFSFFVNRRTTGSANWYPKSIALKIRNIETEEIKICGTGWVANPISDSSYSVYRYSSSNAANDIRNMGPDWVIFGIIFNWRSDASSNNQQPILRFADFRMGHQINGLVGTTRMVLPKALTWGNLRSAVQAKQRKYDPI